MPDPDALVEVHVSVQDATQQPRHLAAGVLGDRDLVLVPAPPPELIDPDREFDVVTIPQPLGGVYPVERLRASCVNVMWVGDDRKRPVGAMLKLRQPSGYARTLGDFSGSALATRLEQTRGDLWAALEELGTVRPGLRNGPPAELLEALPDIERIQRRATYRDHEYAEFAEIGWSICRWLCSCHPR